MAVSPSFIAIVGRPNVGKSTLFNRLARERIAVESPESKTTRDRLYAPILWQRREFILIDTAGLIPGTRDAVFEQIEIALEEADLILFIVDISEPLTPDDFSIADRLRKQSHPVLLVANKADRGRTERETSELFRLGFGEPVLISAVQGRGTGELLDRILEETPEGEGEAILPEPTLRVALIGRPNVGKTSLLNWLAPTRKALVSETPGTTRDTVSAQVEVSGERVEFLDTAGVRRRGRILLGIERWSVLRSLRSLARADIALLVIDASEGPTAGDAHLAGLAKDQGKGLAILVNKWDLTRDRSEDEVLRELRRTFDFIPFAPVLFTSATEGGDPGPLLRTIIEIHRERFRRIETPRLNAFLEEVTAEKPPATRGRRRAQLKYMVQRGVNPPAFTVFGRAAQGIHFSWRRYLENRLREAFGFSGTAIIVEFKDNEGRRPPGETAHRRAR